MALKVDLIGSTPDPLLTLYSAYKRAVERRDTEVLLEKMQQHPEAVRSYIQQRLATGHTSPLEFIDFTFAISGVSRALTHQLVRHRAGVSFEQQSQRYIKAVEFDYIVPPSIAADPLAASMYKAHMRATDHVYCYLIEDCGIPVEDARYVLPNAAATKISMKANFAALLHMADVRLCKQAQWEFRALMTQVRKRVLEVEPLLGALLQPKCGPARRGVCDEDYTVWQQCPLGGKLGVVRPHQQILQNWLDAREEQLLYQEDQ